MEILNDKEVRIFISQHSGHKTDFIRKEGKTKFKCFVCDKMIDVRIARSRVELLDEAEDNIDRIFGFLGF